MTRNRFEAMTRFERVPAAQVARAGEYPAAILCDVAGRRGTLNGRIQPLHPRMKIAGPAFTVEVRPGDNLMIHLAIALAQPGDVIVVDGKGDLSCALVGDLMSTQAAKAGLGGFVIDGAVRDSLELAERDFPVFASGRNPCGPTKNVPGLICTPVSVGNISVQPGDLVVGDSDGVVVIPRQQVNEVLKAAAAKVEAEQQRHAEMREGLLVSPWLESTLRAAGVFTPQDSL